VPPGGHDVRMPHQHPGDVPDGDGLLAVGQRIRRCPPSRCSVASRNVNKVASLRSRVGNTTRNATTPTTSRTATSGSARPSVRTRPGPSPSRTAGPVSFGRVLRRPVHSSQSDRSNDARCEQHLYRSTCWPLPRSDAGGVGCFEKAPNVERVSCLEPAAVSVSLHAECEETTSGSGAVSSRVRPSVSRVSTETTGSRAEGKDQAGYLIDVQITER
jgi:hypothetical protein